jgi:hypothetical protein
LDRAGIVPQRLATVISHQLAFQQGPRLGRQWRLFADRQQPKGIRQAFDFKKQFTAVRRLNIDRALPPHSRNFTNSLHNSLQIANFLLY